MYAFLSLPVPNLSRGTTLLKEMLGGKTKGSLGPAHLNLVFCPPLFGKPDPKKTRPETGPDLRERVAKAGRKGDTSLHRIFSELRDRYPTQDPREFESWHLPCEEIHQNLMGILHRTSKNFDFLKISSLASVLEKH
jgi:hypothetical protein